MENPKICDCPFTDWCHEPRQWVQSNIRKENQSYKVEDCSFFKLIKEKENEENAH